MREGTIVSQDRPFAQIYTGTAPRSQGVHAIEVVTHNRRLAEARLIVVDARARRARPVPRSGVWQTNRSWSDDWERVFSAWIAHLFRPLDDQPNKGWHRLHKVIENQQRNLLYNRLGYREDAVGSEPRIRATADCGDTPYFLRAYFAWKFELPFRYRRCSRGDGRRGPECRVDVTNESTIFDRVANPVSRFNSFFQKRMVHQVHSGTMRTLPEDNRSDFYPISLNRNAIRPGTVFVDSGGHVLMVTQWDNSGLFAIDGHPDKTVTRRRFSEKFFRYFSGLTTGGFKAFRPIRRHNAAIAPVPNQDLKRFFSLEQYSFSSRSAFYRHMQVLIDRRHRM